MMQFQRRRLLLVCGVLACVLTALAAWAVYAQQVTPAQQVNPVQINPPGNPLTLQTFVSGFTTGSATATNVTIAGLAGKTLYITGIEVQGGGSTAGAGIQITLASGGTTQANWYCFIPAGATTPFNLVMEFGAAPWVGLAPGNNAVVSVPSFGAGSANQSCVVKGYYQ
jgi:hypothetical protein